MNKRKYLSPEMELITLHLGEVLANSPIDPHDPQVPVVSGVEGLDEDL